MKVRKSNYCDVDWIDFNLNPFIAEVLVKVQYIHQYRDKREYMYYSTELLFLAFC